MALGWTSIRIMPRTPLLDMKMFRCAFRTSVAVISIAMLTCYTKMFAALPKEEVERLRRVAAGFDEAGKVNNDSQTAWRAVFKAMEAKEYAVVEAALHHPDIYVYGYALTNLGEVPIEERKRLAMMALLDSHLWPDPVEASKPRDGSMQWRQKNVQDGLCFAFSHAFGLEVKYPKFWSNEERLALAERIRRHITATTPPEELPEWIKTPLPPATAPIARAQSIPKAPANAPQSPDGSNPGARSPFRWIAAIMGILGGVWVLLRTARKRT